MSYWTIYNLNPSTNPKLPDLIIPQSAYSRSFMKIHW